MTTIVYDHKTKQIAVDSRVTRGFDISTDSANKWLYNKSDLWFFCGVIAESQRLIDSVDDSSITDVECKAIAIINGSVYLVSNEGDKTFVSPIRWNDAIGSGEDYAKAALDFGKSAKEAVEYAMTRDTGTGGKVHVFDVERMEFIDD